MTIISTSKRRLVESFPGRDIEQIKKLCLDSGINVDREDENNLYLEIFPNRPDLYSEFTITKYLKSFLGLKSDFLPNDKTLSSYSISSEKHIYAGGIIIQDIDLKDIYFDILNFTNLLSINLGRNRTKFAIGIHDLDKIKGKEFQIKSVFPDDYQSLDIDGKKYYDLIRQSDFGSVHSPSSVLKDELGEIALIPITNCSRTKITKHAKNLFLDVSGIDKIKVEYIISIFQWAFDTYKTQLFISSNLSLDDIIASRTLKCSNRYISNLLGKKISQESLLNLKKVGLHMSPGFISEKETENIEVIVPSHRKDIKSCQDILEEWIIANGINQIEEEPLRSFGVGKLSRQTLLEEKLSSILQRFQISEKKSFLLSSIKSSEKNIDIINPLGSLRTIRSNIWENLLSRASELPTNKPLTFYEQGWCHVNNSTIWRCCIMFYGKNANYTKAYQILQEIMSQFQYKISVSKDSDKSFIDGRYGKIILDNIDIGFIGEVSPEILLKNKILNPIIFIDFDCSILL